MKTKDAITALNQIVKVLKSAPDIEINELSFSDKRPDEYDAKKDGGAFLAFVTFSTLSKGEWVEIVKYYNLPVEIKTTDSARDLVGRIMKYFSDNPAARANLKIKAHKEPTKASPELMRALDALLKGG